MRECFDGGARLVLEIGCGNSTWGQSMRERGMFVISTDIDCGVSKGLIKEGMEGNREVVGRGGREKKGRLDGVKE